MSKFLYLIIFTLLANRSHAQQKEIELLTGNIKQDIKELLPEGNFEVDVMNQVVMEPRHQELMEKFKTGIQQNPEWFLEAQQKMTPGQPFPYDKRIGLSESEYKEFLVFTSNPGYMKIAKSSSEVLSVIYKKDKIILQGTGILYPFSQFSIDLNTSNGKFGDIELGKPESVDIKTSDNVLQSKWKGFTWRYEQANKEFENLKSVEDYQGLNMKLYKITIGRLETSGKTYIEVKTSEIENGVKTNNYQIPIIFQ